MFISYFITPYTITITNIFGKDIYIQMIKENNYFTMIIKIKILDLNKLLIKNILLNYWIVKSFY